MAKTIKPATSLTFGRRKMPRQKRAKTTVDSILQAATELLYEEGPQGVSTATVAERAGISIGSLYQYFQSRQAIMLSLYEDAATQGAHKVNTMAVDLVHEPLEEVVPKVLNLILTHYEKNAMILVNMVADVPEIAQTIRIVSFENLVRGSMRMYLQQHHEFNPKDTARHVFFLENIVTGSVRRFVSEQPVGVTRAEFATHLSRLIMAYLKGDLA